MTVSGPAAIGAGKAAWRREFIALMAIGAPMALTQLIQFSINAIDVLMIGQLGPDALAGAALGLVLYYALFLIGLGPAMAVSPMVSQTLGADSDNLDDARRSMRMGFWAIGIAFAISAPAVLLAKEIAVALGQPGGAAALAEPYLIALAPGLPFALAVIALRNFLASIERARAPLYVIIATTLLNAFLNWILIFGNWGAPRLELVGAGIASSLSHVAGFAMLVVYIRWEKTARRFRLFERFWNPYWDRLREIASLSWPISLTMMFEAMLFNSCVLLMGRIGINEMAAYQVAINVAALAFMMPLGLSMAGAVRVGLMQGAGDRDGVRRAAIVAIASCIGAIMLFAVPMMLAPKTIAGLYLSADDAQSIAVLTMAASFLPIASAFALFDAIQVSAGQALRGLKDVRMPMGITFVSYWVIGFPVAAFLGLATPLGAVGVWFGLLASLAAAAIGLGGRLWFVTR